MDFVLAGSVADPHHVDADPDHVCHFDADAYSDPACQFDADPDPTFYFDAVPDPDQNPSFQIKAQNREKVLKLAHFPNILASHLQIDADPDPAYHFDADAYPNPAYHVDADPDPTFQFDADPCASGSTFHNTAGTYQ